MLTCTIETHRMEDGTYRAYAVDGAPSVRGLRGEADSHRAAFSAAKEGVRLALVGKAIHFLHVES
jgi:hypothetical protein